ncbi:hypothetical protein K435DRAFT_379864 [Dendrothele bispora CBS 962.96]|uniref:Uncharacterized protein n=1 Tax=Dendrothele bispora (strain CBS 962.96) TaxID=1314807 RepID=A0A4S8LAE5_DENBC|nr:hypothetical protein K435DRAFT_379864 [Dendrothele bispora CBS 962.96]
MPSGIAVLLSPSLTLPQPASLSPVYLKMVQTTTSLLSLRQLTSLVVFAHLGSHGPDLQKHCSLFGT